MIPDCRRNLPVDLAEGVIRALSLQALGQVVAASNLFSSCTKEITSSSQKVHRLPIFVLQNVAVQFTHKPPTFPLK